jgi:hypothetical protein
MRLVMLSVAQFIAVRGIPGYLRLTVMTFFWKIHRHNASRLSQDVEAPDRTLNTFIEKVQFYFRTAEESKLVRDPKTLNEPGDRQNPRGCSKPKHLSECDRPTETALMKAMTLRQGLNLLAFAKAASMNETSTRKRASVSMKHPIRCEEAYKTRYTRIG